MPKIKKTEEVTATTPEILERDFVVGIDKLEIDLGRGDLNLLRDKINEVIEKYGR